MQPTPIDKILNEVAEESKRISFERIKTAGLRLRRDGRLGTPAGDLRVDSSAVPRLAKYVGVPATFFEHCSSSLRSAVFNEFAQDALDHDRIPPRVKVVTRNGDLLIGVADPELTLLSGAEILETVLGMLPSELDRKELEVADFRLDEELAVSISTPQITAEPRVGDIIQGGLNVRHSITGDFATQVSSFLQRLVCENGLIVTVCQHQRRLRIRRSAEQNAGTTLDRVREVAASAWDELRAKLDAVHRLAEETVANPEELIRAIARQSGLSRRIAAEVISALNADELGGGDSLFDVVNAFSRVGTHSERLSSGRRRTLQELSGDLVSERVEKCPTCGALRRQKYFPEE